MPNRPQKKNVPIQQVLAALVDESSVFPPSYLHQFSDLEGKDLQALRSVWPQVKTNRRFTLLEDLEDLADVDTLVSFDNVARMALDDPDPRVRTVAIRLLWESDDTAFARDLMRKLEKDPDVEVRAAAATGLGPFIYLGELEELDETIFHQAEEVLLKVINSQDDPLVRRRALEAMGYSGRKEVPPLIRSAYESEDSDWVSSALFAISRSADQAWAPEVLRMLRSPKANIQLEAVRAAGALEIEKSRRTLLDMLEEEAQDSEIRAAVIWSLSQIGGEEVRETLETILEETEDEEEVELVENALDNLSFTEDTGLYQLFDFNELGETNREIDDIESYQNQSEDDNDLDIQGSGDDTGSRSPDNEDSSYRSIDPGKTRPRHRKSKKG